MKVFLAGQNGMHRILEGVAERLKIYIAGGVSGNLNPAYRKVARSGDITLENLVKTLSEDGFKQKHKGEAVKVFLAGEMYGNQAKATIALGGEIENNILLTHRPYILESFYYADADTERLMPLFGDFLLDSGAFTFMGGFSYTSNEKVRVDFESYIERYADFIVRNKVEKFFELDVDSVVGYEQVKEYRKKLERLTGRQCIPVWHSTRGKDEFLRSCDEYPYVALGGIVGGEWKAEAEKHIPWFIAQAHRRKAKIHGLGYTKLGRLKECHFDSVDSTAWTTGNRFGYVYHFDGKTMQKVEAPKGKRLKDPRQVALINYTEWLKFQKYADTHL